MKIYTVLRQDKFDYDFSVLLTKIGCFTDKAKAIAASKTEYESMQGEYEDEMLKYSDTDIYNPDEYGSGALYVEEEEELGFYTIKFGTEENHEIHDVWVDDWELQE